MRMRKIRRRKYVMAVWGIGAYFQGEGDITKDCLKEKVAVIGYMEEEKPRYYEMIQSVEVGDLIFIKSRFMLNQPLRIKAVGFVIDNEVKNIPNVYNARADYVRYLWNIRTVI